MIYRIRNTGLVVDFVALQELFSNTYISPNVEVAYLDALGVDRVLEIAPPQIDPATSNAIQMGAKQQENGEWVVDWKIVPLSDDIIARNLTNAKSLLITKIDNDVDLIYQEAIGNRGLEYLMTAQDATAFKVAGYMGEVPYMIQVWADVTNQTSQSACDSILTRAAAWKEIVALIRSSRLSSKQNVQSATTIATIRKISADWDNQNNQIRTQLGLSIRNIY